MLDVLIIGAGPIGLACGIACKTAGLEYLIVERGCLVNSLYNYPLNMTFFSTSEKLEIGDLPFTSTHVKATRPEALEYYRKAAISFQLKIRLYEEVLDCSDNDGFFVVNTSKDRYETRKIIVATGFYDIPNLLNVEGESLPHVFHYYKEAHPYFKRKVLVIGSANSAVDVALETFRKGAAVTMIIKDDQFKDNVKYWVKPDIENRIADGSIKAHFNASVVRITPSFVDVQLPERTIPVLTDVVFAMTGYLPDFSLLKRFGVDILSDVNLTPIYHQETMETNKAGVYLAGVVCGGLNTRKWFIENSRIHAGTIASHIKHVLSTSNPYNSIKSDLSQISSTKEPLSG